MYHLGAPSWFHTQPLLAAAAETILECSSDWLWCSAAQFAHPAHRCDLSHTATAPAMFAYRFSALHRAYMYSGVSSSVLNGKTRFYTVSCDGKDGDHDMQVVHQHLITSLPGLLCQNSEQALWPLGLHPMLTRAWSCYQKMPAVPLHRSPSAAGQQTVLCCCALHMKELARPIPAQCSPADETAR